MSTLYEVKSGNVAKTWALMIFFLVLISAFGFLLALYFGNATILYIAVAVSIGLNFFSYFFSDMIALSMAGATEVKSRSEHTELWNIVENLSITAGLPMPRLYIVNDPIPNAFATGRNENNSAVAVTSGLLLALNKSELEGVIAHEISHIKNRDILVQTIVVVLAGVIAIVSDMFLRMSVFGGGDRENRDSKSPIMLIVVIVAAVLAPIAATIVRLAISRKREYLADASGALLTRYPEGLASALQKISQYRQPLQNAHAATAHMYIVSPMGLASYADGESGEIDAKVSWFTKLFMTHPPVKDRIEALMNTQK